MLAGYSDLFAHQQWADSVHWRALAAHPDALNDDAVRRRLHHIHQTQRRFLDVWKGNKSWPPPPEPMPPIQIVRRDARAYYRELGEFLDGDASKRLDDVLRVPWFPDPQRPIRLSETMQQVVLHSEHHRGQNAIRLRELGGAMPPTDYIYWILEGRPAPVWD